MPHEPDKMMEELLRALVRKRRDGSGAAPELHSATRRLLHSEIARVQKRQGGSSATWWRCFPTLWARVAVATAILAVLGVGSWWMGSGRKRDPMQMAKAAPDQAFKQFSPAAAQSVSERLREKESKARPSNLSEDAMQQQTELRMNPSALAGIPADRYGAALGAPGTEPGLSGAVRAKVREVPVQGVVDGVGHNEAANRSFRFTDALALADQTDFAVSSTSSPARGFAKAPASARLAPSTIAGLDEKTYGLNMPATSPAQAARFLTPNDREKADLDRVASSTWAPAQFTATPQSPAPNSPRNSPGPDAPSLAFSTPSPPPAAPGQPSLPTVLGRLDAAEGLAASVAKPVVFVRIPAAGGTAGSAGSRGLLSVLAEIAFEREGDAVSLREKDGSVYTGQVVRGTEFAFEDESIISLGAERNGAIRTRRQIAPAPGNTNQVFFRVSGTNRVLREFVVFDGQISGRQLTESGARRATTTRVRQNSVNLAQETSQRTLRRLHGTAKVGTNRFEVEAEEVHTR
jgi:hypothetical protein